MIDLHPTAGVRPFWHHLDVRLPGDLRWESGTMRVYAPIMTCILLSLILTLVLSLLTRR